MIGKTNAQVKIGGVDTSDATATSNDILLGKTAYANNEKITGTIPTYNNEHENGYVQINTLKKLLDATQSTYYLFYNYKGTNIDGLIEYDDTENVINMKYMFRYAEKLVSIPLFNTINVTEMTAIFDNCLKLTAIPLLNTSKITNMTNFCYNCNSLVTVPLLDTSNVTSMSYTFSGCTSLKEIPALNVSNVTSFSQTFENCRKLEKIHMTGMKASFNISVSTLFTTEALHEIIDNLATVTSTQTLTMGSTNLAKVSEEYKTIATNKGWTLA